MLRKWTLCGAAPMALAVGLCAVPAIAQGQQAPAPIQLEEIIVTAERRSTSLQDTPIAITALTAEDLREQGVVDLKGVADATPNFQMTTSGNGSGGGNFAQLFIRGVGQPDFIITKDPAVGIYIDGVYLARAPGAVLELLDIERVEVLRGPQGTLFGKNTSGGALNITTQAPSDDFGGVAEMRIGNYGRLDVGGSVSLPLVEDKLALRVSALSRDQDGYYKRLLPSTDGSRRNGNDINVRSGRATLAWTPTDTLSVTLSGDVTRERQAATDYQAIGIFNDAASAPNIELYNRVVLAPQGLVYDDRWIAPKPWTTYSTSSSYANSDVWGVSGVVNWDPGAVRVKSITAYRDLDVSSKADADGTPADIVASAGINVQQHQFSQEFQFSGEAFEDRLNWLVGLWYFNEKATDTQSSRQLVGLVDALRAAPNRSIAPPGVAASVCPASGTGPASCLGGANNPNNLRYDQARLGNRWLEGSSYAAFAHAGYKVTEDFSLTAGGRISREKKDFRYYEVRPSQNNLVSFNNVTAGDTWDVFTPKLGAEYRFDRNMMAYVSWSKGFKAGGVNGRPTRADLFNTFDPEKLTAYEAGFKGDFFDRRLRLNLAAYFSEYNDIQITRNTTDATGAFIRLETNGGDGEIKGLEAEATALLAEGLTLQTGLGYTDFKFTSLLPQQATPGTALLTLDNELPFVPKFTANLGLTYEVPVSADGAALRLRGDWRHSSSYYIDIDNTEAVAQGAYDVFDGRLTFVPASGGWELFVAMSNITNKAVIANGVASPANGNQMVTYKPPRMTYGGVRVTF